MNLVRYIGSYSESGAYIMAPMLPAQKMKIKPIRAFLFEG